MLLTPIRSANTALETDMNSDPTNGQTSEATEHGTANRPGQPGFVERRKRESGRGRRLALYLALTAALSIGLGRIWGVTSVATNLIHSVAPEDHSMEVESPHEVRVIKPQPGGLPRTIVQTGTVEPIESADLHVRVSGYVKRIAFDIGDAVEAGQVVAEIDADEYLKDVEKQAALVELAESRVEQAVARTKTTAADRDAALATIERSRAEIQRAQADVARYQRELERIQDLAADRAIETKIVDEKEYALRAAQAGLINANAAHQVEKSKLISIEANIERARADVAAAKAEVRVAKAEMERAQVMANYLNVISPFDGMITARNFDRGDYVHAATGGEDKPLLTVARNDRMRAVIQVPAPDVPYVNPGQKANVSVNSLGGRVFAGVISRVARNQDLRSRTMRVEVDLDNESRELAGGMYGAVSVKVPAPTNELSIPKSSLIGRTLNGRGRAFVYANGTLTLKDIGVGRTYANRIEVLEGLDAEAQVVSSETRDFRSLRDGKIASLERLTGTQVVSKAKPKKTTRSISTKPAIILD